MASNEGIRDPLYGPIALDATARALIDTAAFQRLRRIRQLSEAYTVYPSAMHTRFEHSLGVHHLAKQIVRQLGERGELAAAGIDPDEARLVGYAALVHDLGHHLGAHLLEEFGYPGISHEAAGAALFTTGDVGDILRATGIPRAAERVAELVQHEGAHALGGIVSGACDADKLDYLLRDAYHCGLPAGFDQPHLSGGLTIVTDPRTGRPAIGLDAGALGSFELMLVSKAALFRTVYFHPTVRCAMVMLRALIVAALEGGLLARDELLGWTDEEVFTILRLRVKERRGPTRAAAGGGAKGAVPHGGTVAPTGVELVSALSERLAARRLYTRVLSLPLNAVPALSPEQVAAIEARLAHEAGLGAGGLLIDIPRKPTMLSTDILVRLGGGRVVHASTLGPDDGFALNAMQEALYAASGSVAVYVAAPVSLGAPQLMVAIAAA